MPSELAVFLKEGKSLMTVPDAFKERNDNVSSIIWRANVFEGKSVKEGDILADVQWESRDSEVLVAPGGCSGVISSISRNITYEHLIYAPPKTLLVLA